LKNGCCEKEDGGVIVQFRGNGDLDMDPVDKVGEKQLDSQ
jgi:hypothetical protein